MLLLEVYLLDEELEALRLGVLGGMAVGYGLAPKGHSNLAGRLSL